MRSKRRSGEGSTGDGAFINSSSIWALSQRGGCTGVDRLGRFEPLRDPRRTDGPRLMPFLRNEEERNVTGFEVKAAGHPPLSLPAPVQERRAGVRKVYERLTKVFRELVTS